ncbi:MAG TPA: GNAT family N-acetyltransferase [Fimbriimonadaceae bacterium]|nr:GNAT family N-acetyltransferase [Fimbriimonadaceae bacterium]HRJ97520.1 GNAT family N-acetyltransferase [Fimbriimonadaceae bacterium]
MFVTEELIRRIERSEAERVRVSAETFGGSVLPIGGGVAANCGEGNVMTQAIGVASGVDLAETDFDLIISHYRNCARFEFKLSVLSPMSLREWVVRRAIGIPEFETILVQALSDYDAAPPQIDIRRVPDIDADAYGQRSAQRFYQSEPPPGLAGVVSAMTRAEGTNAFEVFLEGVPVASCSVGLANGIAWLGGGAVDPPYRGRGLHKAMQAYRMMLAKEMGCELICQGALPGSVSHVNAQKNGFAVAFTRPTFWVEPEECRD